MKAPQDWTLIETDDEGDGPRLWQLRASFPGNLATAQYPTAVIVEWNYADDGLPDAAALAALHAFEQALDPLNTQQGNSLLVHIIRGGGVSELCYYVADHDRFMQDFNDALSAHPCCPLEIQFMEDPTWEYRRSIVDNFAQ